ncbi:MAG: O-antigen ligase family protein [Campylobacterota bacterium]|nr:O-antigen ligase family protein [Campylobacterota bacterium]
MYKNILNILTKTQFRSFDFNKAISYIFIALAFSFPLSNALNSFFSVTLILLWIAQRDYSKKLVKIKKNKLVVSLIFLILLNFISIFWSPNFQFSLSFFLEKYWLFLIVPAILTSFDIKYTKYVINAFLLSMLINEAVSYAIYFEIISYNNIPTTDPSPFMNHIDYSVYLSFAIILLLHKLHLAENIKLKLFYSIYLLTTLSNLFINGGRTGQVILIATVVILSILFFRKSLKKNFLTLASALLTLFLAYNISPNFQKRVNDLQNDLYSGYIHKDYTGSMSKRYALWMIGYSISSENIVYGHGIMGDKENLNKYIKQYNFDVSDFPGYLDYHNTYIQYLVQLGIIGLFLYISIMYFLLTLENLPREYKIISTAFALIFILYSTIGFTFGLLHSSILFCVFGSLFNSLSFTKSTTKK